MAQRKIAIVDNDKDFLEELRQTLDLSGYKTEIFYSGIDFLKEVKKVSPDAVLLDLRMDGKSGFRVADELTHDRETSHIPIIAMTGFYTDKEHALLMKICGAKECLIKPFHPLDVIVKIESVLQGTSSVGNVG